MKKLVYFSLYFSEGAPIGFIWWALPSILAAKGLSTTNIATISAVAVIPWTFKFLLAPIIDLLSLKFLSLKKQLFIYQVFMGVVLLFFENAINSLEQQQIISILLLHGFFAAMQDITIDSMAIKSLKRDELGAMNGIMQTGMLVGRSIFGGGGVYIAHKFGLSLSIYFLITSIWISLIVFQRSKSIQIQKLEIKPDQYLNDFITLLKRKTFWLLLATAYFATYSYNGISTIAGAVLTKKGASAFQYGLTYSLLIPISMSIGALLGGRYSDKLNPIEVLSNSLILSIIFSIIVGTALDSTNSISIIVCSYIVFYFFIGSTTASLYGLLMKKTSKEFAALEFSIFMGVVNLSDSNASYFTGLLVASRSYTTSSIIIALICLMTFVFLKRLAKN